MADDPSIYRGRLRCNFARVDEVFPACLAEAQRLLSPAGVDAWLEGASAVCALGRGQELPLIFLEAVPPAAARCGEALIPEAAAMARGLSASGAAPAIAPYLAKLPAVARRLESFEALQVYADVVRSIAEQAPDALICFLDQVDTLLAQMSIGGVMNWVDYGLKSYRGQLHKAADYFSLQAADARAALMRERHGTLLADHERELGLTLRSFWALEDELAPYSQAFDIERRSWPHLDRLGFHLPDAYEDLGPVKGIDRYRAAIAHLAAHRLWTRPLIADNFNRYQQLIIETFEDARVEWLAMRRYPGLRRLWLALHPRPRPGDCPPGHSCIRHLAAMLSLALLDPQHGYEDPDLLAAVDRFHEKMATDPEDGGIAVELGVEHLTRIHHADFRSPKVFFRDTEVSYRDDNRYLWIFLEDADDEDEFHSDHHVANPRTSAANAAAPIVIHQPEWDYVAGSYRPDWVTVYETLQAPGDPALIDRLLAKHAALARPLQRLIDLMKPQGKKLVRRQEEGPEIDLDPAIDALIDNRSGISPDPRIHTRTEPYQRDISVLVLLDLSESVKQTPPGAESTVLELSREAVSLLGWALAALGDPYAIAGFASNSRHELNYRHIKGYTEAWGEQSKARLSGIEGGLSTRMGAALRHAGRALSGRGSEKKLLLLLTDGEPADVDVEDGQYLHADARRAVEELAAAGVFTFCFSLDPGADAYVSAIFGASRFMVLDRIERLPERLPRLYLELTR
ncbi:hypothetical protein GALL_245960 [mine drainage metagenome]|uniref:VWFA domain-containing protein n=1 Tax=mine drainage metagenome TaxID=410659 RepID=A0A1J5RZC5_9ZZZZ